MPNTTLAKRRRTQGGIHVESKSSSTNGRNCLHQLPLEMLAEILSYTSSPDILSLARTSRFFCDTLVTNPASLFIWKAARRRFHPKPIPDPAPNWTESAYIAFIFDTTACEVCHRQTKRTPFSYALRARICDSVRCHNTWMGSLKRITHNADALQEDLPHAAAVQSWLPCFEDGDLGVCLYRATEWEATIQQHKDSVRNPTAYSQIQQDYARKALLRPKIMQYATVLRTWGHSVEQWRSNVRRYNKIFSELRAGGENWLIQDFVNTPFYTRFRTKKDALAEKITEQDFERHKEEIAEQVAQCRRVRICGVVEDVGRINRKDLRDYWNMLKTVATTPLPPYSEFLHLDMARTLTMKNADECALLLPFKESVREELKNNKATREHIAQQVSAWIQDKKSKLSEVLGYDRLALAKEAGFIHPVDRVTAWFSCTYCSKVAGKVKDDNALTFADVCAHRCVGKNKNHGVWNVDGFEADQKAIAAAKELLRVCQLGERQATKTRLEAFGCSFICKACKDPIVMDSSSVIGHCKRHEIMTLELLTSEHPLNTSCTPIEHGLTAKLMGFSRRGCQLRHRRVFGCRHCQKVSAFTFDGLRSHVKSKHDVVDVRDEDFFQKASGSEPFSLES